MLPGILNQLGADSLTHLKRLASAVPGMTATVPEGNEDEDDDEVPDLVENFDEVSKDEAATEEKISEVTGEPFQISMRTKWRVNEYFSLWFEYYFFFFFFLTYVTNWLSFLFKEDKDASTKL